MRYPWDKTQDTSDITGMSPDALYMTELESMRQQFLSLRQILLSEMTKFSHVVDGEGKSRQRRQTVSQICYLSSTICILLVLCAMNLRNFMLLLSLMLRQKICVEFLCPYTYHSKIKVFNQGQCKNHIQQSKFISEESIQTFK